MHSEFSGCNRSVDFISTSVNEGYYMNFFFNFPEPIVEVNAVVRHFSHPWVHIRKSWQRMHKTKTGKKMFLLGMDTFPSLNDIMEIRCNKCTRIEQGYDF